MRDQIFDRMRRDPDASPELLPVAAKELEYRLKRSGMILPPRTRSRTDKWPRSRAVPVLRREASLIELMIIRAIARTWGAAQFGCSPSGAVFTADTDGWSMPSGRRNEVTELSPLLVEVADIFNEWRRKGVGGRFYERGGCFFDADDGAIFVEVDVRDDIGGRLDDGAVEAHLDRGHAEPVELDELVEISGGAEGRKRRPMAKPSKNLWQRIFGWIGS